MTPPPTDDVLLAIADYVAGPEVGDDEAFGTARLCLLDSLGCGLLALEFPECRRRLGPIVPGATLAGGARVPGTGLEFDPVRASFNLGTMIRWLDYNDTWLAAEWGHPSDNLGAILSVADWLGRRAVDPRSLTVRDVLAAMIKAYEVQGVLALDNAFNRVGLDHVLLVRVASTAVATHLLGGTRDEIAAATSHAWLDGGALRTYRHWPNTGPRKSWAAGDATSRGLQHALMAIAGEPGYRSPLTASQWGFQAVLFRGEAIGLARPLGDYVARNILFKVAFPAEFHGQTAVEAAIRLHPQVVDRVATIDRIVVETQESAVRIIDKTGPLRNPADRDHCLQYMIAVALLHGDLVAEHYEDAVAADPRLDALRERMQVVERAEFSRDYLDPDLRSIANAITVHFADGTATPRIEVAFPLGHRRRRDEARPRIIEKFRRNAGTGLPAARVEELVRLVDDPVRGDALLATELVDRLIPG